MFDLQWLNSRIAATKAQIEALDDAILALSSGGIQSYSMDTGQTKETVTKKDLVRLQSAIDALYSRLAALCAQRDGAGVVVRPAW